MPKKPQKTKAELMARIHHLDETLLHYEVNLAICAGYWGSMPEGLLKHMDEHFAKNKDKPTSRKEMMQGAWQAAQEYREKELKILLESPNGQNSGLQEAPTELGGTGSSDALPSDQGFDF